MACSGGREGGRLLGQYMEHGMLELGAGAGWAGGGEVGTRWWQEFIILRSFSFPGGS